MANRVREQFVIAGAERSGKTFYTEWFARKYVESKQGGVIAYNPGKPEDFADYYEIEFLTISETANVENMDRSTFTQYKKNPILKYFRIAGKKQYFSVSKFAEAFAGKKVKVYKLPRQMERYFWQFVFDWVSDFLLIIDDAKPITRQGVDDRLFQIMSRKNHCGIRREGLRKGKGIDVIFIYHNLDTFSEQIFDYTSRMILFKFMRLPGDKIDNPDAYACMLEAYEKLKALPKYSYFHILIKDVEVPTLKQGSKIV